MNTTHKKFSYGEDYLTSGIALAISQGEISGFLSEQTKVKINVNRKIAENIVKKGKVVYGINTGFGALCATLISEEKTKLLQENILKSHSVGVGDAIPSEMAKLMLILKVHALGKAYSGIAETTLDRIIWHIENDVIPVVPCQGSVGASGDLAPLAHLFLPLIGLGKVEYKGEVVHTSVVFEKEGLKKIKLGPKEGLSLINGTQFMAAYGVKIIEKLHNCLSQADIIAAIMIKGLLGLSNPFAKELHDLRAYKGNKHVAERIRVLLQDSEIVVSHKDHVRVQDPYSLRCVPQVHGASRNAWLHLKEMLEIEINSVTDNPVIFSEYLIISGGNFHGQPIALPLDYACLAASELGNISDRRIYLSLEGSIPGVPKFLMHDTGVNSGFMVFQYTSAALASENKGLCFPASADSIPTALGQEDHVSMGSISGRKALRVIENVEKILGIELLCAAQAFDFHKPLKSDKIINKVQAFVREHINHAKEDKVFAHDIEKAIQLVKNSALLKQANKIAEENNLSFKTENHELFEVY